MKSVAAYARTAVLLLAALLVCLDFSVTGKSLFEGEPLLPPSEPIDQLLCEQWAQLNLSPAPLCSDAVFVRRLYLDLTGTLPSEEQARDFLDDASPIKRTLLIHRLLESEAFADYYAMKWSELLRVKAEFPINLWPNAAQAYYRWIWSSLRQNKPYDQFARELLTANGSNFRVPPVNFYRALQNRDPQGIAQTVALTFLGQRADKWPRQKLLGMAAFFSELGYKSTAEWKEEIVFFAPQHATNAVLAAAAFPDGSPALLSPDADPRVVFTDWLTAPANPCFAPNAVNRIWYWLLGRGLVQEPDDFRPDNPASNPRLLAYLAQELVSSHYDLKHVYELILTSQVYQLASLGGSTNSEAEAHFAFHPLRRMEAEVLIDALNQITGSSETYSSATPEPYTFIPENIRSISLPDGSISSAFLEQFGRPPRDTGLLSERNNRPSAGQRLELLNSTHIQRKIEQSPLLQAQLQSQASWQEGVAHIYLTVLSRRPTPAELQTLQAYVKTNKLRPRQGLIDLTWALINSSEFLYRH